MRSPSAVESNWHEISPSDFKHEREGLRRLRQILPNEPQFEAWTNFEFIDEQGRVHEIDALVNTPSGLYLLELKHFGGTLRGDANTWERGSRYDKNPLKLANYKAKRLAGLLESKLRQLNARDASGLYVKAPFVKEAIFLHADDFDCQLPFDARAKLYGNERDVLLRHDIEPDTALPPLSELIFAPQDARHLSNLVIQGGLLNDLLTQVGVGRKNRSVNDWDFDGGVIAENDDWQEWPVKNKYEASDLARIRFYPPQPGWSLEQKQRHSTTIQREYRLTRDLRHENILSPHGFLIEDDLGPGLVLKLPKTVPALGSFLDAHGAGLALETKVSMIRDLAEAVLYAHRSNVVHRGISPDVIYVSENADGSPRILVSDWRLAGRAERAGAQEPGTLHTGLDLRKDENPYTAPEQRLHTARASRVVLDVFSVGAVAYHILTGRAPAEDYLQLRLRLRDERFLDVATVDPTIPPPLRELVKLATNASHSDRQATIGDLSIFVAMLEAAQQAQGPDESGFVSIDEAREGDRLSDEFTFIARLGRGASALGVQVEAPGVATKLVLKVSRGAEHDARVAREAETLRQLSGVKSKGLVRLLRDEPLEVSGRTALLLSFAGKTTLADQLRQRDRLNLDRLETWGGDVLQAVCDLAAAGVHHRDIKPANLGVLDATKERPRLVLFDFSLSHAPVDDIKAGTHPYLDPFLGGARRHWDSAAELYAAAVTLYQMATGELIRYGDDAVEDPFMSSAGPTIAMEQFDEGVRTRMTKFFEQALAREVRHRFGSAQEMLAAWVAMFTDDLSTMDSDADRLAAEATGATTIDQAGLSDRAVSALAALGVRTVADVVQMKDVSPLRLRSTNQTREEILRRRKEWSERIGVAPKVAPGVENEQIEETARRLVDLMPASSRVLRAFVQSVLGLDGHGATLDVFAPQSEQYRSLKYPAAAVVSQRVTAVRKFFIENDKQSQVNELLGGVYLAMVESIASHGDVATVTEVQKSMAGAGASEGEARMLRGLMAAALWFVGGDFFEAQAVSHISQQRYAENRQLRVKGLVLTTNEVMWPILVALGGLCDRLVDSLGDEPLVPSARVLAELKPLAPRGMSAGDDRLVQLSAMWSRHACATVQGELFAAELSAVARIRHTLVDVVEGQTLASDDIHGRVEKRFPGGEALPQKGDARWVAAVQEAFPRLTYSEGVFAVESGGLGGTTGLSTVLTASPAQQIRPAKHPLGRIFTTSLVDKGFLAIAVHDSRLDAMRDWIVAESGAIEVNVTDVFIASLESLRSKQGKPSWEVVVAADAAEPGSRAAQGLAHLVQQSIPLVEARIEAAMREAARRSTPAGRVPVLLSEAAPLAAYDHMHVIARLAELGSNYRVAPVWLLLPHKVGSGAPTLDGTPLPLAFDGQLTVLDNQPILTGTDLVSSGE